MRPLGGGGSAGCSPGDAPCWWSCSGWGAAPAAHCACALLQEGKGTRLPPALGAPRAPAEGPERRWRRGSRRGKTRAGVQRRTETPGDGNDDVVLSLRRFPRALVRTRGWSVHRGPNKRLLIRPGRGWQARGAQLERRRAPPRKSICLKIGLSICESTFRLFAPTRRLCRSSRRRDSTGLPCVVGRK